MHRASTIYTTLSFREIRAYIRLTTTIQTPSRLSTRHFRFRERSVLHTFDKYNSSIVSAQKQASKRKETDNMKNDDDEEEDTKRSRNDHSSIGSGWSRVSRREYGGALTSSKKPPCAVERNDKDQGVRSQQQHVSRESCGSDSGGGESGGTSNSNTHGNNNKKNDNDNNNEVVGDRDCSHNASISTTTSSEWCQVQLKQSDDNAVITSPTTLKDDNIDDLKVRAFRDTTIASAEAGIPKDNRLYRDTRGDDDGTHSSEFTDWTHASGEVGGVRCESEPSSSALLLYPDELLLYPDEHPKGPPYPRNGFTSTFSSKSIDDKDSGAKLEDDHLDDAKVSVLRDTMIAWVVAGIPEDNRLRDMRGDDDDVPSEFTDWTRASREVRRVRCESETTSYNESIIRSGNNNTEASLPYEHHLQRVPSQICLQSSSSTPSTVAEAASVVGGRWLPPAPRGGDENDDTVSTTSSLSITSKMQSMHFQSRVTEGRGNENDIDQSTASNSSIATYASSGVSSTRNAFASLGMNRNSDSIHATPPHLGACAACTYRNDTTDEICRVCGMALVSNPRLDVEVQIAMNVQWNHDRIWSRERQRALWQQPLFNSPATTQDHAKYINDQASTSNSSISTYESPNISSTLNAFASLGMKSRDSINNSTHTFRVTCGRCTYQNDTTDPICRICGMALVSDPSLDVDEQIATHLQWKYDRISARKRKRALWQQPLLERSIHLADMIVSSVLQQKNNYDYTKFHEMKRNGNKDKHVLSFRPSYICAFDTLSEPNLVILASRFLDCISTRKDKSVTLMYHFSDATSRMTRIERGGIGRNVAVSTNLEGAYECSKLRSVPPVYHRRTNRQRYAGNLWLPPVPESADHYYCHNQYMNNNNSNNNTYDDPAEEKVCGCRGWIVAVVKDRLDSNGTYPRSVKIQSGCANYHRLPSSDIALPLVHFDADLREDDVIRQLMNRLSRVCYDYFQDVPSDGPYHPIYT